MNSVLGRRRTAGALIAAAVIALAGCSTGTDDHGDTTTSTGDETFPIVIESALGEAEITESPERVVTLGQGSTETAIALGRPPVGVERYDWGSDETGYLPWVHEAVTEAGDELPEQFTGGEDIDFPAIVELAPDVILAPWSGITQEQFDILNDIAPTVAYPDLAWSTDWDEQIELIGRALGMPDEAAALITDIEDQFSEAAASRPEYADITFSYIYTSGPGTLGVFLPDEQRVAMVSGLGLTVDPVVETFPETEGTDSALIGLEQADQLADSDLVFTFYSDPESRAETEEQPLYAAIPAVSRDSLVASDENPFVTASSMINPLTVPWTIDRYLPMIDDAISRIG
ncbi:iron complex transport system substrate-binding protein [Actinoalloteichus hoggarensis]|uniref:Putative siderophore-binding lipoprotein YfiY n=1 Tax=Actinoalloteichus hoggarensis TaxID=1470176 RepID=A0A221W3D0_9PSEU|nr:iron-siderophore ABC transporter substrate-binding protein [Actinoalloteichus hoggarensis]ASO20362.1 putative siderophore-binding lipoprotein YfiY precursor [Actinoalloteichus hoggarensis]MBB5923400.1 iron complex transport system substrate-binding protein [Actinoalloteichus hoggarensis]